MPNVTDAQVTVHMTPDQRDCLSTPPVMTPLRIPRRRRISFLLLRLLWTLKVFYTRHRPVENRWINPDYQHWETPTDHMARTEPYLYIHSLSR
jgi:hypothetical protein